MGGLKTTFYVCFCCGGDGKDTCSNPDHGLLGLMNIAGMSANESACPVCGHDPNHKVPSGGPCEECEGNGYLPKDKWYYLAEWYDYDEDPIEYQEFVYVPSGTIELLEKKVDLMIDNLRLNNRIRGMKLFNNMFSTLQFEDIPEQLKCNNEWYFNNIIDNQQQKEFLYIISNNYQIDLINFHYETKTLNNLV